LLVVTDASSKHSFGHVQKPPSLEAVGLVLIMSSVGDYQNASNIIHGFKSTDAPALENLSKYHKHQTQLLSTIFSKIEKKLVALVESSFRDKFLSDIFKTNVRSRFVERSQHIPYSVKASHSQTRANPEGRVSRCLVSIRGVATRACGDPAHPSRYLARFSTADNLKQLRSCLQNSCLERQQ
jgi:hypothetical protein